MFRNFLGVRVSSLLNPRTLACSLEKISSRNASNYVPRRALMYVPGHDARKVKKSFELNVDCIALDIEDGVAYNKKDSARNAIYQLLNNGKPQIKRNYDLGVRMNSVDSGFFHDDMKTVLRAKHLPDTILLPKVDGVEHIKEFSNVLRQQTDGRVAVIAYIESAIAVLNLLEICKALQSFGLENNFTTAALVFGGDDYLANIGASKSGDCLEMLYARQKMVAATKAFGWQAIDIVYIQYKDLDGLKRQSEEGARFGFTGKQIIHPGQVEIVQNAFLPTDAQVKWASGLLKEFEAHQKEGKGAFTYEGSMIDMPTMKQAQNIMDLYKGTLV